MAVYQFSALSDRQAISFDPNADQLNFDQTAISAADVRATAEGTSIRISASGKEVFLLSSQLAQLTTTNITFANGSVLLFGDNNTAQTADNSANALNGLSGNDHLWGFGGNDTLSGGTGDDWLAGGSGQDSIIGGAGADSVVFREAASNSNFDRVSGFVSGTDKLMFHRDVFGDVTLPGRIVYDSSNGFLYFDADGSGAGRAQLVAILQGAPALAAGDIGNFDDSTTGSGGGGATEGDDTLVGTPGDDSLDGLGGDDLIQALGGNDTLVGGDGDDTLEGGLGDDVYFVEFGDTTADTGGTDTVVYDYSSSGAAWILAPGFENLTLTGIWEGGGDPVINPAGIGNDLDNLIRSEGFNGELVRLDGADGDDTLIGGGQGEIFNFAAGSGNYGNDSVDGGGGFDYLDFDGVRSAVVLDFRAGTATGGGPGGSGNVVFIRVENAFGSPFADRITASDSGHLVWAGDGNDTLIGGTGRDILIDDDNQAGLESSSDDDQISGGAGNDRLIANRGNDLLSGGSGNDEFDIGDFLDDFGNDTVDGGDGVDTLNFYGGGQVTINLAANTLAGTGGTALLANVENVAVGNVATAHLIGDAGANVLEGITGDDTLDGGAGNDTLVGNQVNTAQGNDIFVFSVSPGSANADMVVDFRSGSDKLQLDGAVHVNLGPGGTFAAGDARFFAGAGANSGQDASDRVVYNTSTGELWYDNDGNLPGTAELIATLQGAPGLVATDIVVFGGPGAGPINGTEGDDSISGTSGDDTISGFGGDDDLMGEGGNDVLSGGSGNDFLLGGEGTDSLSGGDGNDSLAGYWDMPWVTHSEADTVDGGLGDDVYYVRGEAEVLIDAGGVDTVITNVDWTLGTGFENLHIDGSGLVIRGNAAANRIEYSPYWTDDETDPPVTTIFGGGGNDTFAGSWAESVFHGEDGDDATLGDLGHSTMTGGAGRDSLSGGDGDDWLEGGTGVDSLTGGAGEDSFVFRETPANSNFDRVLDFASGSDTLRFDDAAYATIGGPGDFATGDDRFFAGAGARSGVDAQDRLIYDTSSGFLWYDADGSGSGGQLFVGVIQGAPALAASDIAVI